MPWLNYGVITWSVQYSVIAFSWAAAGTLVSSPPSGISLLVAGARSSHPLARLPSGVLDVR
jgi:hypothetical protein